MTIAKKKRAHALAFGCYFIDIIKNMLYVDWIQQIPMKMPTQLTKSANFILLPKKFNDTLDRGGEYHE